MKVLVGDRDLRPRWLTGKTRVLQLTPNGGWYGDVQLWRWPRVLGGRTEWSPACVIQPLNDEAREVLAALFAEVRLKNEVR